MDLRGFRGYDCVATRLVDEQELTPSGWSPIQPTQYQGERSSNEWFDYDDLEIVGFKIFHLKNREAQFKILSNKIESLRIRSAILKNYLSGFDQWIDRLEVQKSDLQDMNLLQRESALKEIHDRQQESEFQLEQELEECREKFESVEEMELPNIELMGADIWKEKKPYCSWSIFQRGEDVPAIHGPPRFSLLYLCADGVAAFQALYYANSASPKAVAVIQPGTAFGGNWTDFENPSGIFADTVLGNPQGSPQILLNKGAGSSFREQCCWPSFTELICFLDISDRGIGVFVEKDKPGSAPESNSND